MSMVSLTSPGPQYEHRYVEFNCTTLISNPSAMINTWLCIVYNAHAQLCHLPLGQSSRLNPHLCPYWGRWGLTIVRCISHSFSVRCIVVVWVPLLALWECCIIMTCGECIHQVILRLARVALDAILYWRVCLYFHSKVGNKRLTKEL